MNGAACRLMLVSGMIAVLGCAKSGTLGSASSSTSAAARVSADEVPEGEVSAPKEVTMPSGLRYLDLRVGDGALAEGGMRATVHYTGWLTDGTQFDSSVDRHRPFSFRLGAGEVIRGWDEGVKGMRVGGKRKLTIPSDLAYGSTGQGPIPPNSTLIFEVELLDVR